MNRALTMSLLMMLLALGGVARANLVYNGDMELGGGPDALPDGWTHYAAGYYGVSDDTPSGSGQSLYLFDNSGGVYNDQAYQYVTSGIEGDKTYSFSMMYKGGAGVRLMLYYPGQGIAYANNYDGTDVWTEASVDFTPPSSYSAGVEIYLYTVSSYAPLMIDDVSIVPEPATLSLLAVGLVGLYSRKKKRLSIDPLY